MPKEYRTIQEVAGPLMLVRDVENVTYDELGEIELASGEVMEAMLWCSYLTVQQVSTYRTVKCVSLEEAWNWVFQKICLDEFLMVWDVQLMKDRRYFRKLVWT